MAATAFQPCLEAQMRARPAFPTRTGLGSFRGGVRPVSPRLFRQGRFFIRPAFHHDFRVHIFFGNSCFTNTFFDPFFCQQFLFPNRFAFAQPVYIPYPVYAVPSYQVTDSTSTSAANEYADLHADVGRLTSAVEQLRQQLIVGKTLWVFTEQRAQKIQVSDLDVEATRRVNAERGVEIPFP